MLPPANWEARRLKKPNAPLYTQPWDLEVPLEKQSASPREGLEEAVYLPPAMSFLGFFSGTQHPPPLTWGQGGVSWATGGWAQID